MKKILLVLPVYNESDVIEKSVSNLVSHLSASSGQGWGILIADNASNDGTAEKAKALVRRYKMVKYLFIKRKGRGGALREAWTRNSADVYAYCDIDLATDLVHLREMFALVLGGADLAVGNRYMAGASAERHRKRLFLSKAYLSLVSLFFTTEITDFQCGFKAVNRRVVRELLPKVKDDGWFFDTELLIKAESAGSYGIAQMPVRWKENRNSKVNMVKIVFNYIIDLIRLKRELAPRS